MIRFLLALALALVAAGGFASEPVAPDLESTAPDAESSYVAWPDEVVSTMRTLPVQDAGRVKPLSTAAAFTLLRLSGRRSLHHEGLTLEPTAWALDCFFRPQHAEAQRLFQVQTSEVLDAIGVTHEDRKKRDRHSYLDLLPGRGELMEQAQRISGLESDQRDYLERQILDLATNVRTFENWLAAGAFAQSPMPLHEIGPLLGPFLRQQPTLEQLTASGLTPDHARGMLDILGFARRVMSQRSAPAMLPPLDPAEEAWLPITDFLAVALSHGEAGGWDEHWRALELWQAVYAAAEDPSTVLPAAETLRAHQAEMARARGEYAKVESEDAYYRTDLLTISLVVFILAFVIVALLWLKPRSRILAAGAWGLSGIGLAILIAAITWRCILRERPPVTTLYETVLFITACIGLVCLAAERLTRQRLALSLTPILGAFGLFLAFRYETIEAADTMPQLVAVLDTNFWLSTHVTTVTLGYAAGLLAGITGALYLLGRLVGFKRDDAEYYRVVARITYGIICFGLLFSVVGTILGGIWANDSWGRFWGWDPKENGALMIVLAEIAILHARLTGWIRAPGIAMAAVANFAVVVFSWWHVNQLGAGLHSYGHTDGVMRGILIAYAGTGLVLGLGGLGMVLDRRRSTRSATDAASA